MHIIKQYGQYRSGTNYLRALLLHNFDSLVLSNGLGHKHYPPCNWRHWCDVNDPDPEILEAVETNRVLATISVKDPFGLCHSYIRYKGLGWHLARGKLQPVVEEWLSVTNAVYESWLEFADRRGNRAQFVRYEELITNPKQRLLQLAIDWDLVSRILPFEDIPTRVEKGDRHTNKRHNREFWLRRSYLHRIPAWAIQMIGRKLDWTLFRRLGYSPYLSFDPYGFILPQGTPTP